MTCLGSRIIHNPKKVLFLDVGFTMIPGEEIFEEVEVSRFGHREQ